MQDLSKFVAISEEFANNASNKVKSGGLMFDRKVIRVVTPGTLIDEKFMDPYENNFLLAIYPSQKESSPKMLEEVSIDPQKGTSKLFNPLKAVGLAWLDLSTGDFFTQSVDLSTLSSALARIGAREIVLSDAKFHYQNITPILKEERCFVTYHPFRTQDWSISKWAPMLETNLSLEDESVFCNEEIDAGSLLLAYVTEKLQGLGLKLQAPVRRQDNENMRIDKNSLRSLEVLETSKEGSKGAKGSLLHSMRRTVTKSGARLLKDWIGMYKVP